MTDPFTAVYFVEAVLPWVLILVLGIGLRFGRTVERAAWMGVVLEASRKDRFLRFEWVREHAVKMSGTPTEPLPWPPPPPLVK